MAQLSVNHNTISKRVQQSLADAMRLKQPVAAAFKVRLVR